MKKINFLLTTAFIASLSFVSCSKEDLEDFKGDTNTIEAAAAIDVANTLDLESGIKKDQEENGTVAVEVKKTKAVTPASTFTIDFGTGTTVNSITRKGKLKITFTGSIYTKGSVMTIERIDYYINNMKVEGTIKYENTTETTVPQWTRTIEDGKITIDGKVFLNEGTCTVQQTAGVGTPSNLDDNTYKMIAGKHQVIDEEQNTLTLNVLKTLVKNYDCDYISEGQLKIVGANLKGIVDYGNGACDEDYTYTFDNGLEFKLKM